MCFFCEKINKYNINICIYTPKKKKKIVYTNIKMYFSKFLRDRIFAE